MKIVYILMFLFFLTAFPGKAVYARQANVDSIRSGYNNPVLKELIIPSALILYGVIGLENHTLKKLNASTGAEISEHIDKYFTLDDLSQYFAIATVYILNTTGIKGKNNLRSRTVILGTAYLIMGSTVSLIKLTGNELRPDKSSDNSFPSGHTATAFMGAEFLYQEYKDESILYGISGYVIAAGTGFFRMYNKRHWLSDIAGGAGIGILSTKAAYWLYPYIQRKFFHEKKKSGMIIPFYTDKQYGLGLTLCF